MNPELSPERRRQLERENWYVLMAVQALLRLVGPLMEAVALEVLDDKLLLWYWVCGDAADVEEDVEDIAFSLSALLAPEDIFIESRVVQGSPPSGVDQSPRMIYWAKDVK